MALHRLAAYILAQKNQNFPSFIVKNGPEKKGLKTRQKCIFVP